MNEVADQIQNLFKTNKQYFNDLNWAGWVDKYHCPNIAFKDNWNYVVLEGMAVTNQNNKELEPFYEWLCERISLLLNAHVGLSNEQIKQKYKSED